MSATKKIIVVVDDEPGLCESFEDYFADLGYDVRTAVDGAAALALVAHTTPQPCMVICDILMPVMDGVELYRRVKSDPKLRDIPFLFMTSDPARAPAGELVMRKPLNFDILLDSVRKCCDEETSAVA